MNSNNKNTFVESNNILQITLPMRKVVQECCGVEGYTYHGFIDVDMDIEIPIMPENVLLYHCKLVVVDGLRAVILGITLPDSESSDNTDADVFVALKLTMCDDEIAMTVLHASITCDCASKTPIGEDESYECPLMKSIDEIKDIIVSEDLFIQMYLTNTWSPSDKLPDFLPIQQAESAGASRR